MLCYECFKSGRSREAIGLCHHCSAALCADHARLVADPVTMAYPIAKTIVLPREARLLLCDTCLLAFEPLQAGESKGQMLRAPSAPVSA